MAGTNWEQVARQAAISNGIDPDIFARQIRAESNFNPNAGSPAGARGIAQIMPATAKGWGVDPMDPHAALNASAKAMAKYVKNYGGWKNALVAYNAGPGRVGKPLYSETANYVKKILGDSNPAAKATNAARAATTPVAGADPKTAALEFIMKGSPFAGEATKRYVAPTLTNATPRTAAPKRGPVGKDYRWIQQQGQKLFGLKNDAGDSQTTGGKHTDGSEHYSGRAVDFGNAKNSAAQLAKWKVWAKAQGLDVLDEGDHVHVSLPGSGI